MTEADAWKGSGRVLVDNEWIDLGIVLKQTRTDLRETSFDKIVDEEPLFSAETIQQKIEERKQDRVNAITKAVANGNKNWTKEQWEAAKEVVEDLCLELEEEFSLDSDVGDADE